MSLPQDLSTVTEAVLQRAIDEHMPEGAYLDFKRELPRSDNAGRHEFLADISAFANSSGGDLVYGIDEDGEGRATALVAQVGNSDQEALRLQDVLMNGLEPRLPGVQIRPVPVAGGFALVVRVPQSWAGPHRVKTNQHFFIRENGRKRQIDVPELRGLFLRSEGQAQRIRDFRSERLGRILSGGAPHALVPGALLIAHFIPTQAALGLAHIDPSPYVLGRALPSLEGTATSVRVNVDGVVAIRNPRPEGTHGYSQFFRNGNFEAVSVLSHVVDRRANLGSLGYEQNFITLLGRLRAEYEHLQIGTEMAVMLSIQDADRVALGLDRWQYNLDDHQGYFDRKTLVLPDVMLSPELAPELALKPMFDLVWQSAGLLRSFNYDEDGNWAPHG